MFSSRRKLKLDASLYDRLTLAAKQQGYASTDEMIEHVLEREASKHEQQDQDAAEQQLRGLGYLE